MDTPLALVKQAYEAFGRGDIGSILEMIADDVDWRVVGPASLPFPIECKTRQEVADYFKKLSEADDITLFEPREFIEAGDQIVALGRVKATVRATGASFESEWIHVMTIKNGLLTRWVEFFDTAARMGP